MKQIIQYQKSGEMYVKELEDARLKRGCVLVRNMYSLISAGTEKTSVETAEASMLGKARTRPDLVKQVMDNLKRDGVKATYEKVMNRLDNYKELGYSCAGEVIESDVEEYKPGDRVACGGATANHSEVVCVPKNLTVRIPDNVSYEEAAFTTVGAIAMQGVRQADLRVGENVVVIGLGLIGLMTVQILKASGCRVAGVDVNSGTFDLAKEVGCDYCFESGSESIKLVEGFSDGYGADAVIITAGTKSNEPVELALQYCRKKGKVVVSGAVGMNIPRSPFYEKEIDFRIACSYGAGRYDFEYEEMGIDYPYGYVRWTENRNMKSVLGLISEGKLDVKRLITHKIPIDKGLEAYNIITGKVKEKHVGVLIEYTDNLKLINNNVEGQAEEKNAYIKINEGKQIYAEKSVIGFIGAGNFAQSNLLPNIKGAELKTVVTGKPINADSVKDKFGFKKGTTSAKEIFNDNEINTVFIATRHASHAGYVIEALKSGKNVFVEKPLAINEEELEKIKEEFESKSGQYIMTGFNRRFSDSFVKIKKFFKEVKEPMLINYRVHAGFIPKNHWTQSPEQGGRIIGEACHFIDVMQYLTNAKPTGVFAHNLVSENNAMQEYDNTAVIINFSDGSVGNLLYLANGDTSVPKEYCEVYGGGRTAIMNNFSEVKLFAGGKSKKVKSDGKKGHKEEIEYFINVLKGNEEPTLKFESMYLTTLTTFRIIESLRKRKYIKI